MKVKCPTCRKEIEYSVTNPNRPFCSERCQLIDLGQWADETYAIPVSPAAVVSESDEDEESPGESERGENEQH